MRGLVAASAAGLDDRVFAVVCGLAGAGAAAAGVAWGLRCVVRATTRSRSISRCSWAVMRIVVRGGGISCTAGKARASAGRSGALAGSPTAGNWDMDWDIFSETDAQPPRPNAQAPTATAETNSLAQRSIPTPRKSELIAGAICPTIQPAFPPRPLTRGCARPVKMS
jgi:hypothetical protein